MGTIFTKRAGAPAGAINVETSNTTYLIDDGSNTSIDVTIPDDIASLKQVPYLQVSGSSGAPYVPAPLAYAGNDLAGTLASRPAANSVAIGVKYLATDLDGGTSFRSDGTNWVQTGAGVTAFPRGRLASAKFTASVPNVTISATPQDVVGISWAF